jgi:hypothetical protein
MPEEGGNQEPAESYLEKREACNPWNLPELWYQGIQDRQKLK